MIRTFPLLMLATLMACNPSPPTDEIWTGWADIADGRRIPFQLHLNTTSSPPAAAFLIGDERTPVPEVILSGDSVHLIVAEYDAAFRLMWDGEALRGRYERYRTDTTGFPVSAFPSHIVAAPPASSPSDPLDGSFTVLRMTRNGTDSTSRAVFWSRGDSVFGTIVAPSGDDGLFAGIQEGDTVRLARFTGWQSIFLEMVREGEAWSGLRFVRESSPSQFRLEPREEAEDPTTPGSETRLREGLRTFSFSGITLDGDTLDNLSQRFRGKPLIVDIMGTWCHNCLDAAPVLQKIYEEYSTKGLEIVSLGFELRDDPRAGLRNLRIFRDRHDLTYTMLFCGDISDENVTRRISSQLDNFGAYPTALFIDRSGRIIDIHKGFKGPGTGEGYQQEIRHFNEMARILTQE